ncbi:Cytosol aminopeptidase family, N-terminal domain [Singulisphaera sp. GP187]|uniref:M17 family peptidase N-terminal domain-containing protein n=1 Tax=Singulisphaera sp. GP187 TaxID=1882752 RepID=UPI00092749C1|nr:M17 family peptidase N-terminal domain-containing protein [Singulisphaera sp. GP187]SIN75486.1 Cytosol aminopeptidase family, N-terminal domain [Singulisphaera sp. GP187]
MRQLHPSPFAALALFASLTLPGVHPKAVAQDVKQQSIEAPHGVAIKVRMEGPYTAETPLQVVCYFKYTAEGAKRMTGAPVELDKEFRGAISTLRERGEFEGAELETLLLIPPKGSIKARALLLVGLGEEDSLSLARLERVGRVALREASRLGVRRVAFAPLIRDQGNTKLGTGDVESAVVKGMLLAYDTERRLQKEGLAREWTLEEWEVEAGPAYFDDTVIGVKRGSSEAATMAATRKSDPHMRKQ